MYLTHSKLVESKLLSKIDFGKNYQQIWQTFVREHQNITNGNREAQTGKD